MTALDLIDMRMNDGTRHFGCLPETYDAKNPQWLRLRTHLWALPGATERGFVTDEITESWIDFDYRGHHFSVNNNFGDWRFFVQDPLCPDAILREVLQWCERLLSSSEPT